jgi:hypothetical protein
VSNAASEPNFQEMSSSKGHGSGFEMRAQALCMMQACHPIRFARHDDDLVAADERRACHWTYLTLSALQRGPLCALLARIASEAPMRMCKIFDGGEGNDEYAEPQTSAPNRDCAVEVSARAMAARREAVRPHEDRDGAITPQSSARTSTISRYSARVAPRCNNRRKSLRG